MRKTIIVMYLLILSVSISAQPTTGISFETDSFSTLLAKAKKDNKIIFLDAQTSWCYWCKVMDKTVFLNDTVGQFYNEHFINVSIDMEKGQGIDIAKRYNIRCYPTYLFIDGSGNLLHRTSGGQSTSKFISIGKTALDTQQRFEYWHTKYAAGTATTKELITYMELCRATCLPIDTILSTYESLLTENELSNRDSWTILNKFITKTDSRIFQFVLTHKSDFDSRYTADSVDMILQKLYINRMVGYLWQQTPDTTEYMKVRKEVAAISHPIAQRIIMRGDMDRYRKTNDWNNYALTTIEYMKQCQDKVDYTLLNDCAWHFYEHVDNIEHLKLSLSWAKKSIAEYPQYFNTDTYAALLYKLGNFKEARTWAIIAITLGKEEQMNYSETEKLLEKINTIIVNQVK